MQWWLTGKVTWSAPRAFALAFIPGLAISVLGINVALAANLQARAGQKGLIVPELFGVGLLFLVI